MKFQKGDVVIAVHDIDEDTKQGDKLTVVEPSTPCCGGVKFKDREYHYPEDTFELYVDDKGFLASGKEPEPTIIISKPAAMAAFDMVNKRILYNSRGGMIPTDNVTLALVGLIDALGLKKDYFRE